MLLHPRSAAEIYCKNLKVNLNESHGSEYYACRDSTCKLVSCYHTGCCRYGEEMVSELKLPSSTSVPQEKVVFMKSAACFMISGDFHVRPMSTIAGLTLLSKLGAVDGRTLEERTVKVGRDEVLELLKCSLVSRTPMAETFLGQLPVIKLETLFPPGNYDPRSKDQSQLRPPMLRMEEANIHLKLIVNTVNSKVLYAEAEEDFVDLLCSFLTFPLSYLFKKIPCLSFKGCMNNLYKSIKGLEDKLFESEEMKKTLLNSKLAPGLACTNQLTRIREAISPTFTTLTSRFNAIRSDLSSMSKIAEAKTSKGFIKGPAKFMVMDNLTFRPLSPMSGLSLINAAQIPLGNIGEQEVTMGEDEALHLLLASFVSSNALTGAFMLKEPKQEKQGCIRVPAFPEVMAYLDFF